MLNYKLNCIRSIVKEIERLESMKEQISKSNDAVKKKNFYANLQLCKEEKEKLTEENLLDDLYLSDEEKEMAWNYYYKGMDWNTAFETSKLFESIKNVDDNDASEDLAGTAKKAISRNVQKYYKYYKKKK